MTAVGEMQEQPMLTVQPNLFFGTADGSVCGGGAFEFVVQESNVGFACTVWCVHSVVIFCR